MLQHSNIFLLVGNNGPVTAYFLSRHHIVFGMLLDDKNAEYFLNIIIVLGRFFIYKCNCQRTEPYFSVFTKDLVFRYFPSLKYMKSKHICWEDKTPYVIIRWMKRPFFVPLYSPSHYECIFCSSRWIKNVVCCSNNAGLLDISSAIHLGE